MLMLNLGLWQLRRLDDRRVANTTIAAAIAAEPVDIAAYLDSFGVPPDHTAIAAAGSYLAGAEVRIANRSSGGQPGFWLATPLQLQDGRIVAVVRGWAPRRALAGLDARSVAAPSGPAVVAGLAFGSVPGGRVAEVAAGEAPEISQMDLARFEEVTGLDTEDVWIRLRAQSPPQPDGLPAPVPDPDLGEGPHLSYAFQWFFFTAGTVVVYGLILRRAARAARVASGRARVSGDPQLHDPQLQL
ncbi:MAG: SURF1 family protein [Acidimicrobiaceae bacterium]|nr:SURF1 family protein [Acidimicrobiaceae bacterium]